MSAFNHGSRERSGAFSKIRFSNCMPYDPWRLEVRAVYKRYDPRLPQHPAFPKIIAMNPQAGFKWPCTPAQVKEKLQLIPDHYLTGLRAIFLLPGTRKQWQSWYCRRTCYGMYKRACVFLFAHPVYDLSPYNIDTLSRFFLDDVLIHEIGHHNDPNLDAATYHQGETFAENFVRKMRSELAREVTQVSS